MQSASDLDARALGALYDEGYYHGLNSGYPAAGYESEHASWTHWVDLLATLTARGGRWLDLGCAYGYLVGEALSGGFASTGVDVSVYALERGRHEVPAAQGRLARAVLEALPFADGTFDVVSAFDVLEHVLDPEPALREAARVLRRGGMLIGATPDPMRFARREETHFSERPPAYWIDRLLGLGFAVDFRFFQAPYNLEWLARREGTPRLVPAGHLRPDGFAGEPDLGTVRGDAAMRVAVRLRGGFGAAGRDHPADVRWVADGEAEAYCLVAGRAAARLAVGLEVRAADDRADVTLALDDQRLGHYALDGEWRAIDVVPLPVAAGGHRLRLVASAPLLVRRLDVCAEECARDTLLERLPFDMYQRYAQCRAVSARLGIAGGHVLDVGGVLGGEGGHLATAADFFPSAAAVVSTDVRWMDHPDHRAVPGAQLPFAARSFDLVVCQDVLEHVPPSERTALLDELARVSRRFLLLAAPFATPGVADADALLFALVRARHGYTHAFLAEHLTHGHPALARTVAAFEARGARVVVLPNGYLPYWTLMQAANLLLAEPAMGERYAHGQARYNARVWDWREPAYRHLLVVDLAGDESWEAAVRALMEVPATVEDVAATALSEVLSCLVAGADEAPVVPPLAADSARQESGGLAAPADGVPARRTATPAAPVGGSAAATTQQRSGARSGQHGGASACAREDDGQRVAELERFAARVRSHPAYRLYVLGRRWWRWVGGDRRP